MGSRRFTRHEESALTVALYCFGLAIVAAVVLFSLGCKTTAVLGGYVKGQTKHTLNTHHPCIDGPATTLQADLLTAHIVAEAIKRDYLSVEDYEAVVAWMRRYVMVCTVDLPEPCDKHRPCRVIDDELVCARKAGCTIGGMSIWVAKHWPPRCTAKWPDEPHCQPDPAPIAPSCKTLGHELGHIVFERWVLKRNIRPDSDGHNEPFFRRGGPVDAAVETVCP